MEDQDAGIMVQGVKLCGEVERVLETWNRQARVAAMEVGVDEDGEPPEYRIGARGGIGFADGREEEGIGEVLYDLGARIERFLDGSVEAKVVDEIADATGRVETQVVQRAVGATVASPVQSEEVQ